MNRKFTLNILKYAVAALLLYYVLSNADLDKLTAIFSKADPLLLIIAFAAFQLSQIINALRMLYYYRQSGHALETKSVLVLHYVSLFYNILVPGGVGGDAYRVFFLRERHGIGLKEGVRLQLCNRASGLASMLFLMLVLTLLLPLGIPLFLQFGIVSLSMALMLGVYFLGVQKFLKERFSVAAHALRYSMLIQFSGMVTIACLAVSIGATTHLPEWLLLFLIASVAGMLPITVGGLGIREFVFFEGAKLISLVYGEMVTPEIGVSLSLGYFGLTLLTALLSIPLEPVLKRMTVGRVSDNKTPPSAPTPA